MLQELPTELIELIGIFLEGKPRDLKNLRLTSTQLSQKASRALRLARYRTVRVTSKNTVLHVRDIAADEEARHMVEEVYVDPMTLRESHNNFCADALQYEILAGAVRRFPKCRAIMTDHCEHPMGGPSAASRSAPDVLSASGEAFAALDWTSWTRKEIRDRRLVPTRTLGRGFGQFCAGLRALEVDWWGSKACPHGVARMILGSPRLESLTLNGLGEKEMVSELHRCLSSLCSERKFTMPTLHLHNMGENMYRVLWGLLEPFRESLLELSITSTVLTTSSWRAFIAKIARTDFPALKTVLFADLSERMAVARPAVQRTKNLYFSREKLAQVQRSGICHLRLEGEDSDMYPRGLELTSSGEDMKEALLEVAKAAEAMETNPGKPGKGKGRRGRRGKRSTAD